MDSISVNNVKKKPVKKTTSSKKSEKKTVKAEKQPRKTTKIKQISSENQEKPKIVRKKKHILIIEE